MGFRRSPRIEPTEEPHGQEATEAAGCGVEGAGSSGGCAGASHGGELVTQFGVHPAQVYEWKRRLLSGAVELFQDGRSQKAAAQQQGRETELYEQIGRLKMELEWLKKTAQRS